MNKCPKCSASITAEDVNVKEGIGVCRSCGEIFRLGQLFLQQTAQDHGSTPPNAAQPPSGAWLRTEGDVTKFGATTRSWLAIFLVPFSLVWVGGVCAFSTVAIAGLIRGGGPSILFLLFLTPFWVGACFLISTLAMSLVGHVEVTIRGMEAEVFTGVGSIGRRKRFALSEVSRVTEGFANQMMNSRGAFSQSILLEGTRRVAFGSMLSPDRRYFLLLVLRSIIEDTDKP